MCSPHRTTREQFSVFFREKGRIYPGFSLVEVSLALGILAFTLTALFGVFAVGARADRQSIKEMEATNVIQSMITERRSRPVDRDKDGNAVTPPDPKPILPALDAVASDVVYLDRVGKKVDQTTAEFGLVYRVTPTNRTNGSASYSDVYCAVYWPAQGVSSNAEGRVEFATRVPLP